VYLGTAMEHSAPDFLPSNVSSRVAPTIVAADFNGDGKVDLCFADVFDAKIWVMLGNGMDIPEPGSPLLWEARTHSTTR